MTRPRSVIRALLAVAMTLVVAACGLSENSGPQEIAPGNLPPDLLNPNPGSSTTVPESPATTSVQVFFIKRVGDRDRLAAVEREVTSSTLPGDRIAALLAQPTDRETELGFTTSIPANTVLLNTAVNEADHELVVDLSSELFSIQGEELAKAFAEIVWTVSELDGIDQVRFLVNGVPVRAPDAEGVEQDGAVTTADYAVLAPL